MFLKNFKIPNPTLFELRPHRQLEASIIQSFNCSISIWSQSLFWQTCFFQKSKIRSPILRMKEWNRGFLFVNKPISPLSFALELFFLFFFLYFVFSTQLTVNKCLIKVCRWLDSNCRSLASEVTALPTEPHRALQWNCFK